MEHDALSELPQSGSCEPAGGVRQAVEALLETAVLDEGAGVVRVGLRDGGGVGLCAGRGGGRAGARAAALVGDGNADADADGDECKEGGDGAPDLQRLSG